MLDHKENEEPAVFNDALKTLARVCRPLDEIPLLNIYPPESPEKQRAFIELVTRFFVLCAPLLKITESDKYKKEILEMQVLKKMIIKSGVQSLNYRYDSKLNFRLWEILIELQQKIKKYLMPDRREDSGL